MLKIYDNHIELNLKGREIWQGSVSDDVEDLTPSFDKENLKEFIDFVMYCINFYNKQTKILDSREMPMIYEYNDPQWIEIDEEEVYFLADFGQDTFYYEVEYESSKKFVEDLFADLKKFKSSIITIMDSSSHQDTQSIFNHLDLQSIFKIIEEKF